MGFPSIKLSRDELYQKVWEQPVSVVAKGCGISEMGLVKMCRRLQVPLPGLGYWAKKQHGKPVEQTPLPPPPADTDLEVRINAFHSAPADAEQLQKATEIADAEELEANAVHVPDVLTQPHPTVAYTLKVMGKAKPGEDGRVSVDDAACLPVEVSPQQLDRSLRIMDALLKAFAVRGYPVTMGVNDRRNLSVTVTDESISFSLSEDLDKTPRPMTAEQKREFAKFGWRPHPEFDYAPTGKLSLQVNVGLGNGMRRKWSDSAARPLERRLNTFLAGLVKIAVALRAGRLDRERRIREMQDAERRRKDLQVAQEQEKASLLQLDREVADWRKAQDIRAYLDAVRVLALRRFGRIDPDNPLGKWLTWAAAQADRYDPLVDTQPAITHGPPNPR